jgi:hypothetical protein
MTYITYGPSPTSHFRITGTPGDSLLASPLDCAPRSPATRGTPARSLPRAALRGIGLTGVVLVAAAAVMALRLGVYALIQQSGLL